MADKSTAHRDAVLNTARGTALPAWTPYVSLHTADPGLTGANEVTGSGYARQPVTLGNPTNGSHGRQSVNTDIVNYSSIDATESRTVTHAGVWTAATGGTFRYRLNLAATKVVVAGETASFQVGEIILDES